MSDTPPTPAELEWRMKEYELMRAEIAARVGVHHSFMSWATLGAGGIIALGVQQWGKEAGAYAWGLLLPLWTSLVASIVVFEWLNTERLGRYAKLLESRITEGFIAPAHLRGWEHSLGQRRSARGVGAALTVPLPLAAGWAIGANAQHRVMFGHAIDAWALHTTHLLLGLVCAGFYFLRWHQMNEAYRPSEVTTAPAPPAGR